MWENGKSFVFKWLLECPDVYASTISKQKLIHKTQLILAPQHPERHHMPTTVTITDQSNVTNHGYSIILGILMAIR